MSSYPDIKAELKFQPDEHNGNEISTSHTEDDLNELAEEY